MTIAPHRTETVAEEPLELLRSMLEEQFILQTGWLTELTVCGPLPGHGGYDPHQLDILTTAARQTIADTAQALRRMSEGTYGRCEECHRPIPLGRLRAVPHARYCTRCRRAPGLMTPPATDTHPSDARGRRLTRGDGG